MSKEVIYEAACPACDEIVKFEDLGDKICPHCKGSKATFDINWIIIEEKEDA